MQDDRGDFISTWHQARLGLLDHIDRFNANVSQRVFGESPDIFKDFLGVARQVLARQLLDLRPHSAYRDELGDKAFHRSILRKKLLAPTLAAFASFREKSGPLQDLQNWDKVCGIFDDQQDQRRLANPAANNHLFYYFCTASVNTFASGAVQSLRSDRRAVDDDYKNEDAFIAGADRIVLTATRMNLTLYVSP